jgi:nucleoside-diphosphate kinase
VLAERRGRKGLCEKGATGPAVARFGTRHYRKARPEHSLLTARSTAVDGPKACAKAIIETPASNAAKWTVTELSRTTSACYNAEFTRFYRAGAEMAVERTLSIIKPDAVARNAIGEIYARFEKAGLRIAAARMMWMSRADAEGFYAVHKERPFFRDLVDFMTTGPVMIQVLEGDNAIAKNRELMGATDPKKAAPGTIRADFAESIDANAVHGSDAPETAVNEIAYFFPSHAVYRR